LFIMAANATSAMLGSKHSSYRRCAGTSGGHSIVNFVSILLPVGSRLGTSKTHDHGPKGAARALTAREPAVQYAAGKRPGSPRPSGVSVETGMTARAPPRPGGAARSASALTAASGSGPPPEPDDIASVILYISPPTRRASSPARKLVIRRGMTAR
jgi:hypothetical protein